MVACREFFRGHGALRSVSFWVTMSPVLGGGSPFVPSRASLADAAQITGSPGALPDVRWGGWCGSGWRRYAGRVRQASRTDASMVGYAATIPSRTQPISCPGEASPRDSASAATPVRRSSERRTGGTRGWCRALGWPLVSADVVVADRSETRGVFVAPHPAGAGMTGLVFLIDNRPRMSRIGPAHEQSDVPHVAGTAPQGVTG